MENLATLIPVVLALVETIKRFVPEKSREIVNPILAMTAGLLSSYFIGGTAELTSVLIQGLLAGSGAIALYKIPKVIGNKLINVQASK